jgi:hypothetical protein
MFHYTRPSFNTMLPPEACDGLMAGNMRHVLSQDDPRIQNKKSKERTVTMDTPKQKANPLLTTRAPTKKLQFKLEKKPRKGKKKPMKKKK